MVFVFSPLTIAKEKPEWRSWPLGDRLVGSVAYFKPKLDTEVAIGTSQGEIGALVNFESSLGMEDTKGTVLAGGSWRISRRNALSFSYFKLDRGSSQGTGISIKLGDEIFTPDVDLPIEAFFNIEATNLIYSFSAIMNEKMDLALGIGLSMQDLEFGVQQTEDCAFPPCDRKREDFAAAAPVPTLNIRYRYAFSDKWIGALNLGWLAVSADLDNDEKIDGEVWTASAALRWKTWKNVGFNLGYNFFDLDVDWDKGNTKAAAVYSYKGFVFGIDAYF
jgi:hypothetical protein